MFLFPSTFRSKVTQKGQYGKWTENELQMAVARCRNGDCGLNKCSRVHGIPKTTIRRLAMKKNWRVNDVKALGRQAAFIRDMEKILADHIIMLEERLFGLNIKRKLTFELAE
jgi:hypothetical protein